MTAPASTNKSEWRREIEPLKRVIAEIVGAETGSKRLERVAVEVRKETTSNEPEAVRRALKRLQYIR